MIDISGKTEFEIRNVRDVKLDRIDIRNSQMMKLEVYES